MFAIGVCCFEFVLACSVVAWLLLLCSCGFDLIVFVLCLVCLWVCVDLITCALLMLGGYVLAGVLVVWCLWCFVVLPIFACVVLLMPLCCAAEVVFYGFG